jgi:hypothetical protein
METTQQPRLWWGEIPFLNRELKVGEVIGVKPRAAITFFKMVYEGMINNEASFVIPLSGGKITAWRDELSSILECKEGLLLSERRCAIYEPGCKEYEGAKQLLIKGGLWS